MQDLQCLIGLLGGHGEHHAHAHVEGVEHIVLGDAAHLLHQVEQSGGAHICLVDAGAAALFQAVCGAGRALGFVCAPSLFQYVIKSCLNADISPNVEIYRNNRDILYNSLVEMGYECVYPDGAFYLFVKSPEPDANAFSERAKKHELLIVPGDDFGCPGYVRISYCVREEMIRRSLPAFRALMEEYRQGF